MAGTNDAGSAVEVWNCEVETINNFLIFYDRPNLLR